MKRMKEEEEDQEDNSKMRTLGHEMKFEVK